MNIQGQYWVAIHGIFRMMDRVSEGEIVPLHTSVRMGFFGHRTDAFPVTDSKGGLVTGKSIGINQKSVLGTWILLFPSFLPLLYSFSLLLIPC